MFSTCLTRAGWTSRMTTATATATTTMKQTQQQSLISLRTIMTNTILNSNYKNMKRINDWSSSSSSSSSSSLVGNGNGYCYSRGYMMSPSSWFLSSRRGLVTQAEENKSQSSSSSSNNSNNNSTTAQSQTDSSSTKDNSSSSTTETLNLDVDQDSANKIAEYTAKVEKLEAEVKKFRDACARREADLINLSNMTKKDMESARTFAVRKFSGDMLLVADALQGALRTFENKQDAAEKSPELKSLIDGVRLTEKTLMDVFSKHGVQKVQCKGAEFDPNLHQALFQVKTKDHPEGTIVQVLAEGYTLNDHVLRPARVGVAAPPEDTSEKKETEE